MTDYLNKDKQFEENFEANPVDRWLSRESSSTGLRIEEKFEAEKDPPNIKSGPPRASVRMNENIEANKSGFSTPLPVRKKEMTFARIVWGTFWGVLMALIVFSLILAALQILFWNLFIDSLNSR